MTTHFYPFSGDSGDLEQAPCGTWVGEASNYTGSWEWVTCGRCLRSKKRITTVVDADEKEIVRQMGDMADFMSRESIFRCYIFPTKME